MEEYLVESSDKKVFIILAENSENAIDYVYTNHYEQQNKKWAEENDSIGFPIYRIFPKTEFVARSLNSIRNEKDKAICIKIGKCFND